MRRVVLIAVVGALVAGCGGGETVSPEPEEMTGTTVQEEQPAGDPAAGKTVYAAQGCGSCHTFGPAGSKGTIGPNLDELPQHAEKAGQGTLEEFTRTSIVNPNAYVEEGFPEGVMPAYDGLEPKELNDLVAFLTQG